MSPEVSEVRSGPGSTTYDVRMSNRTMAVRGRQGMLALMALLVLAALLTILGVHTSTATAEGSGYRLDVLYPRTARPGLDAPLQITVTHPGGFRGQVTLEMDAHYLDLYESQGFRPSPSDETREGDTYYLTFSAPPGDVFRVYFDAYIQPASQRGRAGWVAVVDSGHVVVRQDFSTILWP